MINSNKTYLVGAVVLILLILLFKDYFSFDIKVKQEAIEESKTKITKNIKKRLKNVQTKIKSTATNTVSESTNDYCELRSRFKSEFNGAIGETEVCKPLHKDN